MKSWDNVTASTSLRQARTTSLMYVHLYCIRPPDIVLLSESSDEMTRSITPFSCHSHMGRPLAAKRAAVQTAAAVDAPIRISRNCPWNVTRCRCTVPETRLVLIYSQWVARYRAAFGSVGMLSVDLRVTMGLCTILDDLKVLQHKRRKYYVCTYSLGTCEGLQGT